MIRFEEYNLIIGAHVPIPLKSATFRNDIAPVYKKRWSGRGDPPDDFVTVNNHLSFEAADGATLTVLINTGYELNEADKTITMRHGSTIKYEKLLVA